MPSYARGSGHPGFKDQYGQEINEMEVREAGALVRGEIIDRINQHAAEYPPTQYDEGSRSTARNRPQSRGVECLATTADGSPLLVRRVSEYRDEGGGWHRYPAGDEQVMIVVEPRESQGENQFERVYVSLANGDWDVWLPERSPDPIARPELTGEDVQTEDGFARRALGAIIKNNPGPREPLHVAKSGIESLAQMMRAAEFAN